MPDLQGLLNAVFDSESNALRVSQAGSDVLALQRRVAVPVASRAAPSFGASSPLSDGVSTGQTTRYQHTMLASAHSIVLAYSNFYNNAGVETDGPNPITVRASVEPANGRQFPVFFNGLRDVTIPPGSTVYSDPITVDFAKGVSFWSRTFVTVSQAGYKWPLGGFVEVAANLEGDDTSATPADHTTSGSVTTGAVRAFGPSAVLGHARTPGFPVVGIVGDSIAAGTGDTTSLDQGFVVRALGGNYSYQSVAFPSETVDGWMQQDGATRWRRASLVARCGITHFICELGINSIGNPDVQAHLLAVWQFLADMGAAVFQTTITPKTTSTDSWATTANQTVTADEAARVALNAYIRSLPAPLTGFFEIADLAESARDSGKWKVNGTANYYTADGVHPSSVAHAALAAGVVTTAFGSAST